ncbi:MAG: FlgD immunoglobulin-like domain containing protein [Candidatus Coatesbacteria bacterium]
MDGFEDLKGISASRHVKLVAGGGVSLDPAEQVWTVPANARFSAGKPDPTIEILAPGSSGETVTLWQRIYEPGQALAVASACAPVGTTACPIDPAVHGVVNGRAYPRGLSGFPLVGNGNAAAAGWDTPAAPAGSPPACAGVQTPVYGGISPFSGSPILSGGAANLAAGHEYAASFSASADHDGSAAPYLSFGFWDRAANQTAPGAVTVAESDLGLPLSTAFAGLTHVTVTVTPPAATASYDVRVVSQAGSERHCTVLGPVYLTAQEGVYRSPVLDTLSDQTAWTRIEWDVDQSSNDVDPACACPTPGSPLTPVAIAWDAGAAPPVACSQAVPLPVPGIGNAPVPAGVGGRYLGFCVTLYGRETAAAAASGLAPTTGARHFSGWRPVVRRLTARYYARAAEVVSKPVSPSSLKAWNSVSWEAETSGGSTVAVDLLAADGTLLFAAIPRTFPLAGSLDAYRYPSFVLRARLAADPGNPGVKPVLKGWKATWIPLPERLILDRNAFTPGLGESVSGLVAVERDGRVRVRVHDAAGNTIVRLVDGWYGSQAVRFTWDGRGAGGRPVAAGMYFITATTAGGAGTRKVAVRR